MLTIEKVKTLYGLKYAVVEPFTSTTEKEITVKGKVKKVTVTETKNYAVEYIQGNDIRLAIFPLTAKGLEDAKDVKAELNRNKAKKYNNKRKK